MALMKPTVTTPMRKPLVKREDHALLTGQGQFTGDVELKNPLHLIFARSEVAAGVIAQLDVGDAQTMPGVAAVHTAVDTRMLGALTVNEVLPIAHLPQFEILAETHVQYVGQPIAAVLAETVAQARDAAEAIWVDVDEDSMKARETVAHKRWSMGDADAAFKAAAVTVSCSIQHPRLAPSPMEPRAISVAFDPEGQTVTIWQSTQTPHRTRSELAKILCVDPARIRVIARDVGGAFGMKASLYPEEVVAVWAAFQHQRDVKWQATRSEDFLSATHGRGLHNKGELAVDADGNFIGLRAEIVAPVGAWLPNSALIPAWNGARILPSGYRIKTINITTAAKQDGLCPTGIYRGAGRPEANMLMERLIDKAARATGLDPLEIRRKNMLDAHDLPYKTHCGDVLDSGDYTRAP
jgi:carbon-monoxide dehydrogenase large subunit